MGFENIFRTTHSQSNIAANFAAIPFNNTAQGNLTEIRTTAQFSRFDLKVTDKFDLLQTFWQNPRYGTLLFYSQTSYLTRSRWYVAAGNPKNAHLVMVYAGVRYVLPTMSGTLLKVLNP